MRHKLAALLIMTLSPLLSCSARAETVQYWVDVNNTWSQETHPGLFPRDAHFSWFGGGVHNGSVSFWEEGAVASPGMVLMAETGVTTSLFEEVNAQVRLGNALIGYDIHHWFCPSGTTHRSCGDTSILIRATDEFSAVTLVSMLGPSPDWFVGTSGLDLRDSNAWREEIVVDLRPYDGGTRSANVWALGGPQNNPPEPIALITEESGQLVGPGSLGTMTFRRVTQGDFDVNEKIDANDIDILSSEIRRGSDDTLYDLNQDLQVSDLDRMEWVHSIARTWLGDANLDGFFLTDDFVQVFQAGKYEDGIRQNAGWADGDWNGDGEFDSSDLVAAFTDGGYEGQFIRPRKIANVPEPKSILATALAFWLFAVRRRSWKRDR